MRKLRSVVEKSNKKTIRVSAAEAMAGQFCEVDGQRIDPQELFDLIPFLGQRPLYEPVAFKASNSTGLRYPNVE